MTNEETRLINNEQEPGGQPKVQNQTVNNGVGAAPIKSNKKSSSFAAAAGGFVGGAAAGAATTAAATPSAQEIPQEIEASETVDTNTVNTTAEAPNPNDVILANDEGIRYAHVDADNFNDAFAQAREQVGTVECLNSMARYMLPTMLKNGIVCLHKNGLIFSIKFLKMRPHIMPNPLILV